MLRVDRLPLLAVAMLLSCVHVSVAGNGRRGNEKPPEPDKTHYNFQSYQVAPDADYGDYGDYNVNIPDYEDDPRLDQSMCNYTQTDVCRANGFTNLTALNEAGSCQAKNRTMGRNKYTHECSLTDSRQRVNYCCCQFFDQMERVNYTLLMCCKKDTGAKGVYACNNYWNTVDQLNEYADYNDFNTASSLVLHLMTFAACLLLTTPWSSEQREW